MDEQAFGLLAYLGKRVTLAVGDNAPQLAAAAGLRPEQLDAAAGALCAAGLAYREPLGGGVWRLGITDAGVEALSRREQDPGAVRPWWRPW